MLIEIDYSPYPYQEEFHEDETRFRLIVGGRRVGKSKLAMQEILRFCLIHPNSLAWWVAPTYKDAKEVGWEEFQSHKKELGPAIKSTSLTELKVEFINGSKIYFKGSDKYDSLRGRGLNFLVIDEAAFCHVDTWKKALRPALSDKKGRAIFTSTPNGRNWFWNQFKHASDKWYKAWSAYHWPSHMNPLLSEADLEDAKAELSLQDYRQEFLAEFVTKAGMVYDDFSDENIINDFTWDSAKYDLYLGIDFGFASYTAVAFMAVDNLTQEVIQFDEIYATRVDIQGIADMIQAKLDEHKCPMPRAVYTDPAGNAEELSSGISPVDHLRREGFTVINKGTHIAPGLTLIRSFICNAKNQRRFFIHDRCKNTIDSFYGYSYKFHMDQATEEPEKDGIHDHCCDAVRYFFVNKFDHAKYVTNRIDQSSYLVGKKPKSPIMKKCGSCHNRFLSRTAKHEPPFLCNACREKK